MPSFTGDAGILRLGRRTFAANECAVMAINQSHPRFVLRPRRHVRHPAAHAAIDAAIGAGADVVDIAV